MRPDGERGPMLIWPRDRQVPRLAGQDRENHPAHPRSGTRAIGRTAFLALRLSLGQEARCLCMSERQAAADPWCTTDVRSSTAPRSGRNAGPIRAKCCTTAEARKIRAISMRTPAISRRKKMKTKAFAKSQDERKRAEMRFAHRENPSWLRADAAQGTFRGTRRIPFTATQPPTILSG